MSALIGTVIVLAITIAGIAVALFMGAPILVRMQERAALENVLGQFGEVRAAADGMYLPDEARYPTISIPAGRVELGPGSHAMATVVHANEVSGCTFRVTDWEDWNGQVTASFTGCSAVTLGAACTGEALVDLRCLEILQVEGATLTRLGYTSTGSGPYTLTLTGGATFGDSSDYLFRYANNRAGSNQVLYAQAWLMHMDRLSWRTGGVEAAYEGGAIFAQEGNGYFLSSPPAVSESPLDGPFFLRFTTLQGSEHGALSGSDSHSVGLVMDGGNIRIDYAPVWGLRLDFHGDYAEAWCNAFLLRDSLSALDGDYYTEDASEPGHACSPGNPDADGIRSVRYAEVNGGGVAQQFTFTLTQTVLHGSLLL